MASPSNNNNAVMVPQTDAMNQVYVNLFQKIAHESQQGKYDQLGFLFKVLQNTRQHPLLEKRPDLCAQCIMQLVFPRLNDPKFPEVLKNVFPSLLTVLKAHKIFTRSQYVPEDIKVICKDGSIKFNSQLLCYLNTPFFRNILTFGKEASGLIEMPEFSLAALLRFKAFLYENKTTFYNEVVKFEELSEIVNSIYLGQLTKCDDFAYDAFSRLDTITKLIDSREKLDAFLKEIAVPHISEEKFESYSLSAMRTYSNALEQQAKSIQSPTDFNTFLEEIDSFKDTDVELKRIYDRLYKAAVNALFSALKGQAQSVKSTKELTKLVIISRVLKTNDPFLGLELRSIGLQKYLKHKGINFRFSCLAHHVCIPVDAFLRLKALKLAGIDELMTGILIEQKDLEEVLLWASLTDPSAKKQIEEIYFEQQAGLYAEKFKSDLLHLFPNLTAISLFFSENYPNYNLTRGFYEIQRFNKLTFFDLKNIIQPAHGYCIRSVTWEEKPKAILINEEELQSLETMSPLIFGKELVVCIQTSPDLDFEAEIAKLKALPVFQHYQFGQVDVQGYYRLVQLNLRKEFGGMGVEEKDDGQE